MQIERININDIVEYENNAKKHPQWQIEQIARSIEEFGFNDPIAIDEDNMIIEGHGRYLALKHLGYEEVNCIRLTNLTEEQKRAYILAHNKLTLNTDFDLDKLEYELNALKVSDFDISVTGFSEEDLEDIERLDEEVILDIPNDYEDDVTKQSGNQLKFGKYKMKISNEEYEELARRYKQYIADNGVVFGFVKDLLGME